MLKQIIERLKQESKWGYFEDAFLEMQNEILEEMKSGRVKDMEDLIKANTKLEMLDRLINLEFFKGR